MRIPDSVSHRIFQYLQAQNTIKLLEGDIFAGRVISVDGDFLLMQLFDGREVNVQVNSGASYNAGDILKLKVIDKQQERIIATETEHYPAQNKEAPDKAINPETLLKSLSLPVTKSRIDIVNTIIDMGKEATAEIIEKALSMIEKMHIEDPRYAVFLVLNGLEGEERYLEVMKELDTGKFHFAEELSYLINLLDTADDETLQMFAERIRSAFKNSLVKPPVIHENPPQQNITIFSIEPVKGENPPKHNRTAFNTEWLKMKEIALPKVEQWINDLKKELSLISKFVADSAANDKEKILSSANKLESAIRFFNELQGFELYAQIPLIINDSQTNGELYIMKRSGRKGRINSRDFTLFLSLSTENIGDLDIFVHVKSKNVMVKIFAGDVEFYQLFVKEYKSLFDALKEKGYNLFDLGFEMKNENISIFNAEKKASALMDRNKAKIDIKV